MTCKNEGSTHFACDCVLAQLQAADEVAKAWKVNCWAMKDSIGRMEVDDALAAYEKVRFANKCPTEAKE